MQIIMIMIFLIAIYFFTSNVFNFIFSLDEYKLHKKRLKELNFDTTKKTEMELKEIVDKATKPIISHIIPRLNIKNLNQVEKDLKMAQWDKHMTPIQYVSLSLLTKALGIIVFILLNKVSMFMAVLWSLLLFFSVSFLMSNSAKNRRQQLMVDFPDFIRITQGYLSANTPLAKAIESSIDYVGDEWKPILRDFVITNNLSGIDMALNKLKEDVDIWEVKEFVSIIKLTLEQGASAKDGFESQADKVMGMIQDVMMIKIGKRKMMGILIQAPLLLCIMVAFGLPVVDSFMSMGL